MKKRLAMIFAVMLICLTSAPMVFGAGLTVESIYPKSDDTGLQIVNQMARIVFSGEIDVEANKDCFKIVDANGKAQDIMVLEQEDEPNRVNLVLVKDLEQNMTYTIVIDGALTDKAGNELGKEYTSSFTTRSQKTDSIVTTIMMVVMFGAVIVFTLRDQRKQQDEQDNKDKKAGKEKKVNPYKEAKKGGKKSSGKKSSGKKETTQDLRPLSKTQIRAEEIRAQRKKEHREKVNRIMEENKKKNSQKKKK
ncbi:MAG: Ig-like domain-containing protein [Firmicutes bacterium]|nr:Ig-like domain-containing protein [Bacillota bacterium]